MRIYVYVVKSNQIKEKGVIGAEILVQPTKSNQIQGWFWCWGCCLDTWNCDDDLDAATVCQSPGQLWEIRRKKRQEWLSPRVLVLSLLRGRKGRSLRCVYQMKKPLFLSSMTRPSNKLKLNSFNIFSSLINNIIINNLQIRERERGARLLVTEHTHVTPSSVSQRKTANESSPHTFPFIHTF